MSDTYRLLVTGSRDWDDEDTLVEALIAEWITQSGVFVLVHGACSTGADAMAAAWADRMGSDHVTPEPHPAEWTTYGRVAGPLRNALMVELGADACLAFYKAGAKNEGTSDCANRAEKAGIPVTEWYR